MHHARLPGPLSVATGMLALLAAAGTVPASSALAQAAPTPTYREPFRPQYHFTPAAHWMNDPNGLVFFAGEWHLFFQYNPFGDTWGHMSWGHAVSPDLVHWRRLPVAIAEADGVMAFSGSAVVDWRNSSGFGTDGVVPLVAIYTGYRQSTRIQAQQVAYSTDSGRTWSGYAGNPVIDIGSTDFRDPKVFWYAPQQTWIMVLALSAEHKVRLYSSPDLKRWKPMSEFGPAGATGGAWECPDLFELPVDGERGATRWVLIVNVNPGGVAGGSGTQYFVGTFDGRRFTAVTPRAPTRRDRHAAGAAAQWADYGQDFYAGVSWSDVPPTDGRRIWIGWMNNWLYGSRIPTSPWRGAQSLPRALGLARAGRGFRLLQRPVRELQQLRGPRSHVGPMLIPKGDTPLAARGVSGRALEISAVLRPGTAAEFGLKVRTGPDEETVIGVVPAARRLFVDRSRSGEVDFDSLFGARQSAPLLLEHGSVRLHIYVDWSSVEVFAGRGESVITDRIFPAPRSDGVALYAKGGSARLVSLDAWPVTSTW